MEDLTGQTICGYEVTGRLGRGGQSAVYRAEDVRLRRTVALKILPEESLSDRTSRKRFLLEARTLSAMNHPNIAKIFRVDEYQGRPLIVMEYIEGRTLSRHVAGDRPPLEARLALMIQIVEAVRYAHGCGVLHRDLKPENILVTPGGEVRLVDFGLAKLLQGQSLLGTESRERLTETGTVMGTLAYLSPEQAQGRLLDERSDLFSLGIIFYELLTGTAPFPRDTPINTVVSIINSPPKPVPPDAALPDSSVIRPAEAAGEGSGPAAPIRGGTAGPALRNRRRPRARECRHGGDPSLRGERAGCAGIGGLLGIAAVLVVARRAGLAGLALLAGCPGPRWSACWSCPSARPAMRKAAGWPTWPPGNWFPPWAVRCG